VRSAVHWPELITAPLLLLHGEADWRVQAYQARGLSDLLIQAGKTVRLLIYPDDDHELSGHGGGIAEALAWLQRYIGAPEIGL
jgi:dipeptidyl aminopeptidase/acylaminoacyl peptidase